MALVLVTGPTEEPVSLPEAKLFLRQDGDADDTLIESFIRSARAHLDGRDGILNRALCRQTWDLKLDRFPNYYRHDYYVVDPSIAQPTIFMPLPPLISVTSITYIDTAGATQTVSAADYIVDADMWTPRIVPAYGKTWPPTRYVINAVTVRFVAGFGAADDVPDDIRNWMKGHILATYENRELVGPGSLFMAPHLDGLISKWIVRARECVTA